MENAGCSSARVQRSCLLYVVACAVLAFINYRLILPEWNTVRVPMAILSAAFLSLGVTSLWYLVTGQVEGRQTVLDRGKVPTPPRDGDALVVTGRVRNTLSPLVAPLSGTPCVAYFYRMYQNAGGDDASQQIPAWWGYAAQPFQVDTGVSSISVRAVPQLAFDPTRLSGTAVTERARSFVGSVTPEVVGGGVAATAKAAFAWVGDIAMDEIEAVRRDWRVAADYEIADLILEEAVVPVGAEVSVHGRWSSEKGALVTPPGGFGNTPVSIVLGAPSNLTGPGVEHSMASYWTFAIVATAVGGGLLWWGHNFPPP